MLRPSVLAVLRLITRSNLVGCITGKSPGLAPLRIRPGVDADLPVALAETDTVTHQSPSGRVLTQVMHHWDGMTRRQRDDLIGILSKQ